MGFASALSSVVRSWARSDWRRQADESSEQQESDGGFHGHSPLPSSTFSSSVLSPRFTEKVSFVPTPAFANALARSLPFSIVFALIPSMVSPTLIPAFSAGLPA